jgi:ribosomal protein S18 acetylase RimI-like enzyme
MTDLQEATDDDEGFLYDVFCTTWESEIAALPNPSLAHHILRIQYTAQNRRFQNRYPHHERHVVMNDGQAVGRLYLQRDADVIHVVDMTLLPEFRSRGIGTELVRMVVTEATKEGRSVTLRVARRNTRAAMLYSSLGFNLVTMDDLDSYFEFTPAAVPAGRELADTGI